MTCNWTSPEGAADDFGDSISPVRKHMISSSLTGKLRCSSEPVTGDPVDYVRTLRATVGGRIVVAGGIETVRRLFLAGVVDVPTLTIHPVITGERPRLLEDTVPLTRLTSVESTATPAGNAVLNHALRE